jgi:mevalonate kinase
LFFPVLAAADGLRHLPDCQRGAALQRMQKLDQVLEVIQKDNGELETLLQRLKHACDLNETRFERNRHELMAQVQEKISRLNEATRLFDHGGGQAARAMAALKDRDCAEKLQAQSQKNHGDLQSNKANAQRTVSACQRGAPVSI